MEKQIHTIDATGQKAGRLASQIAFILQGKNRPDYQANNTEGDSVVVTNVKKIEFSGKKLEQKKYYRHSNYPGGIKETKLADKMKNPEKVIRDMVYGMLPTNRLRDAMLKRLTFKNN